MEGAAPPRPCCYDQVFAERNVPMHRRPLLRFCLRDAI